jgi:nitrous oxide reductase accessory protein NosL
MTSYTEYGVRVPRGRTRTSVLPFDDLESATGFADEYGGVVVSRTVTVTDWKPLDPAEVTS